MRERRRNRRSNTPHRVNVVEAYTDRILGRLVDITPGGFMIVGDRTWPAGHRERVRIPLPTNIGGRSELEFEAEVLWDKLDTNPLFRRTGFRFVEIRGEDAYIIETVMHRIHLVG